MGADTHTPTPPGGPAISRACAHEEVIRGGGGLGVWSVEFYFPQGRLQNSSFLGGVRGGGGVTQGTFRLRKPA